MSLVIPARPAIVLVAALWLALPALGMSGHWFAGLFVALALMVVLAALGAAHRGAVSGRLLAPILLWAAIWGVSFALAEHHRLAFAGRLPEFTLLGFHPSFAWIVLGYWLAGSLVLTWAFVARRDDWLSEARWQEFRATIARLDREAQAAREARR